ncbi:MAG: VOC family protein [Pseudomonadota bacterium]
MANAAQLAALRTGLCPLLTLSSAADAIAFYEKAFLAEELYRLIDPSDGRIGHAELLVYGNLVMVADEYPEAGVLSPQSIGGTSVRMNLVVDDAEAATALAVDAGAELLMPVTTHFYGDRASNVRDPFGYTWMLSQVVEHVAPEEMQQRWNDMVKGG